MMYILKDNKEHEIHNISEPIKMANFNYTLKKVLTGSISHLMYCICSPTKSNLLKKFVKYELKEKLRNQEIKNKE